ncbi:endolytic transglycosylase MltG [Paracoccaceae bacterium]|nr:endolytic transglycosylase MltG [Paracoccaceae bacterium]
MATLVSNLFYFFLAGLTFIFITVSGLESFYAKPGPSNSDKLLIINKGQSVSNIASRLRDLNLIENRITFILVLRLKGFHNEVKFGEYMIPKTSSIKEIVEILVSGVSVQHKIIIPEGSSTGSIVTLINSNPKIKGGLINYTDEGVLAPNTYSFDMTTTKVDLLIKMRGEQKKILNSAWSTRALGLPLRNSLELLVLASIVEKEAGNEEDKKKVASVFLNRLKKKMRLQSDPTVVYSLTAGLHTLGRELTKSDLKTNSPFNTYKISGLPPKPICNPSKSSIYAVANPLETDFLFFVANGKGGHNFSQNLQQHNRFVKEYRRLKEKN